MKRLGASLVLGVLFLLAPAGASASHDDASSYDVVEQALYDKTVAHRGYIQSHPNLVHLAQRRALEILREYESTGSISHRGGFIGIGWYFCRYSEIIAYSPIETWDESTSWAVEAWHDSPIHESAMHSRWASDRIGVGRAGDPDRGRFYVEVFADYCP